MNAREASSRMEQMSPLRRAGAERRAVLPADTGDPAGPHTQFRRFLSECDVIDSVLIFVFRQSLGYCILLKFKMITKYVFIFCCGTFMFIVSCFLRIFVFFSLDNLWKFGF